MFKWIDRSQTLSHIIERVSTLLARQRGLPVVLGIALVIASLVIQLIVINNPSQSLEAVGAIFLHVGILLGLIGLLLAQPLGN